MACEGPLARVVVVENASGDASATRIRDWAYTQDISVGESPEDWLVLLQAATNQGYAAGNNIGLAWIAKWGSASHVWLLNPDTVVTPSALPLMLERMAKDESIGTCGALLCEMDQPDRVQCYAGAGFHRWTARPFDLGKGSTVDQPVEPEVIEQKLGYVMGACLLASRAFLEAAGPMDKRFFLYFEEIAWQRAAGVRFRPGFAADAVVFHRRHGAGGRQEQYLFANRLRFARWYQPWTLPTVALGLLATALRAVTRRNWPRARLLFGWNFWRFGLLG